MSKTSLDLAWGAAWVPSPTYSLGFVVTAYLQITDTCSMAQSLALWKRPKMFGCIDWTKLDYIYFVAGRGRRGENDGGDLQGKSWGEKIHFRNFPASSLIVAN
jgi:hypothetical protein